MTLHRNETLTATVLSASRRSVLVLTSSGATIVATSIQSSRELCVGDHVRLEDRGKDKIVVELLARRNSLSRSYRNEIKVLASNLDRLFLVTSTQPLFQAGWIDRILAIASAEEIPVTLIVNKADLGVEDIRHLISLYQSLGLQVLITSTVFASGLDELAQALMPDSVLTVALAGVSGVGKSSLINTLIPGATQRTAAVNSRTGRGKQTTTQPLAYPYHSPGRKLPLLIIDLPGVQNLGTAHLSEEQITHAFPEILRIAQQCPFDNCAHLDELECAVKLAAASGAIAASRFESYCHLRRDARKAAKCYS